MMYRLLTILGVLFALSCHSEARADCPDGSTPTVEGKCFSSAIGTLGDRDDDEPMPPAPSGAACDAKELLENFKWFHDDAPKNAHTSEVRGIIMRVAGYDAADFIRDAYKEGQKHRPDVAGLIDACDDDTVNEIANEFAEMRRVRKCGTSPPALSATCPDLLENLRWALLEAKSCSEYSRYYLRRSRSLTLTLRQRAQLVRESLKVAQGHKQEVFDSVDYIGDALLVDIAEAAFSLDVISPLSYRNPNKDDAATVAKLCPGLFKLQRHWYYGDIEK